MPNSTSTYYLTAAIPYINAKPHLGHVMEWFQTDALARYQRLLGKDVAFACGADENSLKNVRAAEKAGVDTQAWLDQYAEIFEAGFKELDISLTSFRRASDQKLHWPGVQELWRRCEQAGDIYKKTYSGLYCVGCESFYSPDELIDGKCPEHLTVPETVEEENYFFKLSKYQAKILQLIESDELRITSDQYKNEMLGFVRKGLEDFSVSRSTKRGRGVGVPVPDDNTQVMYVWFDALTIYLTAIGWGTDQAQFEKYWPADVHVIGKGINRFHSVYWIGMLLSAGLPTPKNVCVHGYITANGQKMSKSLGNVIDPFELVEQYSLEPVRYFLLKEIPTHNDGDFSYDRFREVYTADLANGLGNLCSRIAKLCEKANVSRTYNPNDDIIERSFAKPLIFDTGYQKNIENFELSRAAHIVTEKIAMANEFLSSAKPWKESGEKQKTLLWIALSKVLHIAYHLKPFMPQTAEKILHHFQQEKITAMSPLFPRLSDPEST